MFWLKVSCLASLLFSCRSEISDFKSLDCVDCSQEDKGCLQKCVESSRLRESNSDDLRRRNQRDAILFPGMTTLKPSRFTGDVAEKWCNKYKNVCSRDDSHAIVQAVVVGGAQAEEGEFPHMAAVGYGEREDITWICGGALISEYFILTAGHCINDRKWGPAKWIKLGTVEMGNSQKGQIHPVTETIIHPEFKPHSRYNDIALLKIGPALGENIVSTLSSRIHPACLQVKDESFPSATYTAWRQLVGEGNDNLKMMQLLIKERKECNKEYENINNLKDGIVESQLCADHLIENNSTCWSNSGCPLQTMGYQGSCLHRLIGISSFGKSLCNQGTVFSYVSYYIKWIEEQVWPEH